MAAFWLLRLLLKSQVTKATKNQAIRGSAIAAFDAASCLRTASPPLLSEPTEKPNTFFFQKTKIR